MSEHPPMTTTSSRADPLQSLQSSESDDSSASSRAPDASSVSYASEPPDPWAQMEDTPWETEDAAPLPPSWPMTGLAAAPAPPSVPLPTPLSSSSPSRSNPTLASDSATFARLLREGAIAGDDGAEIGAIGADDDDDDAGRYDTVVLPSHWISEEERWNTATFLALTGHHATPRVNRPPTRPLPRPKRFKRASRIRSGALFVILLAVLIVLVIGAPFVYRTTVKTVDKFFQPTPHPTATPAIMPTSTPAHKKK